MRVCHQCGRHVQFKDDNCPFCAAEMADVEFVDPAMLVDQPESRMVTLYGAPPPKAEGRGALRGVAVVLLLVAVAVAAWWAVR